MSVALCAGCWKPTTFHLLMPTTCVHCGSTRWRPVPNVAEEPTKPYKLSENDRALLRTFRIAPEV